MRIFTIDYSLFHIWVFFPPDWMEMMMMQNHQMHQLVVQQMMLHSLPGGNRGAQAPVTYMSEPTVVVCERYQYSVIQII